MEIGIETTNNVVLMAVAVAVIGKHLVVGVEIGVIVVEAAPLPETETEAETPRVVETKCRTRPVDIRMDERHPRDTINHHPHHQRQHQVGTFAKVTTRTSYRIPLVGKRGMPLLFS